MVWWHWWWMDTIVSLAVALVVLWGALSLIWQSVMVLMGRSPLQTQSGITDIDLQQSAKDPVQSPIPELSGAGWLGKNALLNGVELEYRDLN
jgi:Co/Zn/Cd efflux system component